MAVPKEAARTEARGIQYSYSEFLLQSESRIRRRTFSENLRAL
jgi:hypothetical protein